MLKIRFNLRKAVTIACLAVTSIMFLGCNNPADNRSPVDEGSLTEAVNNREEGLDNRSLVSEEGLTKAVNDYSPVGKKGLTEAVDNLPSVDEKGLTKDIRNIIPDEYIETLKDFGFQVNGGNTPPNVEGCYLAGVLELVAKNFSAGVAFQKDMYLTFYEQNNEDLTVKVNYNLWSDHGTLGTSTADVKGLGSFITGTGNKFTIFAESIRTDGNSTAKTVEVFSGEITANGIEDYQWAVIMIDNGDGNDGKWIKNGHAYIKRARDGLAVYITLVGVGL
jgi:hypothetical protein